MARIDRSNYEAWLLDRLEGRLAPSEEQELRAFLLANSELDPGDEGLPGIAAGPHALDEDLKAALKRALPPTGEVTRGNLEDFLAARVEGDLGAEQEERLCDFLRAHPEHDRDARLFVLVKAIALEAAFAPKDALRRTLPPSGMPRMAELDDFLVAHMEGELSEEQARALDALIAASPEAARAARLMHAARIAPTDAAYPGKHGLKRGARIIAIGAAAWWRPLAAAASLALLLGLGWRWLDPDRPRHEGAIAAKPRPAEQSTPPVPASAAWADEPGGAAFATQERPADAQTPPKASTKERLPRVPPTAQPGPSTPGDRAAPAVPEGTEEQPIAQAPSGAAREAPAHDDRPIAEAAQPEAATRAAAGAPAQPAPTLGHALAALVRERVLEQPSPEPRPLDAGDVVAAADKGLRAIGGEHAGLTVARDPKGRGRSFELRLGRNLAVSARR